MDDVLERLWRAGEPPFDGDTLRTDGYDSPIALIRAAMLAVVPVMAHASRGQPLYTFSDWHEHDGWHMDRSLTTWAALERALVSEEAFFQSRDDDAYVYITHYPEDASFLLRYWLEEKHYGVPATRRGAITVSGTKELIECVRSCVPGEVRDHLVVEPTLDYFNRMYAGPP